MENQKEREKMSEKYWTNFNYVEFELPIEAVKDCSHQGECYEDAEYWQKTLNLGLNRSDMIKELLQYGAWEIEELNELPHEELEIKLIWLAANDINEELHNKEL